MPRARSTNACGSADADMTIRTALLDARLILGDETLFAEFLARFRHEVLEGNARAFIEAKLAEQNARHRAPAPRAIWSSPTSRKARAACATCTRCTGSPSTSIPTRLRRSSSRPACSRRGEYRELPPLRGLPLDGALPPALPHRPGRGAADLRPATRDGRAARLSRACGPAARVERFMKHYFLIAKEVGELTRIVCCGARDEAAEIACRRSTRCWRRSAGAAAPSCAAHPTSASRTAASRPSPRTPSSQDPVNLIRLFVVADEQPGGASRPRCCARSARTSA